MRLFVLGPAAVFVASVGLITGTAAAERVISVRGLGATITIVAELAAAYQDQTGQPVAVEGGGSATGPTSCLVGGVELAFVSRQLTEEEKQAGLIAFSYAHEAVAVVVNARNPVDQLTLEQLKDLFAAKTATWNDGKPVIAYTDPAIFSTRECFQDLVMDGKEFGPHVTVNQDLSVVAAVTEDATAIGCVAASAISDRHGRKVLKINGVRPTPQHVRDNRYPICRTLSLVAKGQPTNQAKAFIDFVLSPEGQQIVSGAGFLPVEGSKTVQTASIVTDP